MIKFSLVLFTLLFQISVFARQYIQCAGQGSDRTVINIDHDKSSLYMMDGFDDESNVRVFKYIKFDSETATHHVYVSVDGSVKVEVPKSVIGESSNSFTVNLIMPDSSVYTQDCYSRIY